MFFGNTVQETRQFFYRSWKKYRLNEPLLPLEQQLAQVILDHPEYHAMLEQQEAYDSAYFPELGQSNPFLHMGLHLSIREQVATDRPAGIANMYQKLIKNHQKIQDVEHQMMECLAETLWQAQKNQQAPDEKNYLAAISKLLR